VTGRRSHGTLGLARRAWRSLPGDLLGLVVLHGLGIRAPNRVHDAGDVRALVVEDRKVERYFRFGLIPTRAQTLGRYVFATYPLDPETMAHECQHIRQWQRFGPLYLPAYFASSALALVRSRKPYWDNSFEVAARRRAAAEFAPPAPAERDGAGH
jgi:hypothetical protein